MSYIGLSGAFGNQQHGFPFKSISELALEADGGSASLAFSYSL
jgi:hypothetical protein